MRLSPVLVWILFPGCWAVTGPGSVHGLPGGSVAVWCQYERGYEDYLKFWCRAGGGLVEGLVGGWFCSNGHIVETDGSEAEVTRGRVSIRDNHTQRVFTVTLENLTRADAGTYHCGVVRTGLLDLRDTVEVTVSAAIHTSTSTGRPPVTTEQPSGAASTSITLSISSNDTHALSQLSNVHFLLLVIWKVPIFLCIIWVNIRYRKNSREMPDRPAPS
ncbi:CMRF35-like molecule 5 [Malaclemys terrapin pileata]|uniref:CMRF35-like molecule 5 n=1 Tax=Malaclemys terrapin pileata TaxID=2991368 RepID=UPI0023A8DAC8|nr:CMRF35-like molecule 5 [Malaclemys terrapin pileata]